MIQAWIHKQIEEISRYKGNGAILNWDITQTIIKIIEITILPLLALVYHNIDKRIKNVEQKIEKQPTKCSAHDVAIQKYIKETSASELRLFQVNKDHQEKEIESINNTVKELKKQVEAMRIEQATLSTEIKNLIDIIKKD